MWWRRGSVVEPIERGMCARGRVEGFRRDGRVVVVNVC